MKTWKKFSNVVSNWKPGLVSDKYRQNYDRIFRQIETITDGTLFPGVIDFYYLDRMLDVEYEWMQKKRGK